VGTRGRKGKKKKMGGGDPTSGREEKNSGKSEEKQKTLQLGRDQCGNNFKNLPWEKGNPRGRDLKSKRNGGEGSDRNVRREGESPKDQRGGGET